MRSPFDNWVSKDNTGACSHTIKKNLHRFVSNHLCINVIISGFPLSKAKIGAVVVVMVWELVIQLSVQSVPITTNVVSSNLVHGEVYSIQCYVIKFVSDMRQVGGFLKIHRFPPPIKLNARI